MVAPRDVTAAVERDFGPSIDGADVTELFRVALPSRPIGSVQRYPIAAIVERLAREGCG